MKVAKEAALCFGVCLLGEAVSNILPFPFPACVLSMILLAIFLFLGAVEEKDIEGVSEFLMNNMAFFFLPTAVGVIEYTEILKGFMLPVFVIIFVTVPIVYFATAMTAMGIIKLMKKGGKK